MNIPMTIGEQIRRIGFRALQGIGKSGVPASAGQLRGYYQDPASGEPERQTRLTDLLDHAKSCVPFYNKYGGGSLEDFPILTKDIIRDDPKGFYSSDFDRSKVQRVTTSGSSGEPFECFHEREKVRQKLADILYYNRQAGYEVGLRHLLIRATAKPRLKLWLQNELWVDPTHWDDVFRQRMRSELLKGHIKVAIGYPSVMADLAAYCAQQGSQPMDFGLRSYIATSEVITAAQRDTIRAAFGCEIASRYATEEFGVLGQSGPDCELFALNTHSLVIEVLKMNADVSAEEGETGRVVVTDLCMRQMPLIRYDTGDLAIVEKGDPKMLGVSTLKSLEGKTTDIIYDTKGDRVAPLAILVAFKKIQGVRQFQFAQTGPQSYELRLSPHTVEVSDEMTVGLQEILGSSAMFRVKHMNEIPARQSGKLPVIVNEMP